MREPNPTEPANYTGSYTTVRKEIEDTEIAMYQSVDRVIIDTINIVSRTTIITTTAMQMLCLLKPRVSEEQEGGLRN
jgi:hypothetical protein